LGQRDLFAASFEARIDTRDVAPHDIRAVTRVYALFDLPAVQPAVPLDVETVSAAGDGPVVVDEATARVAIQKGADVMLRGRVERTDPVNDFQL
jgi:hypothetical protein